MRVALTQMDIAWENPVENRRICIALAKQAADRNCDWIIFPEMTLTGFTMRPELFAEPEGSGSSTADFFCRLSSRLSIGIIYGYIASHDNRYTNQLAYIQNGTILQEYAKLHPFSFGEEARHYTPGDQPRLVTLPELCMSGFICYDLRFPEIFQAVSDQAELIVVIANWPASRINHWHTLLQARAIENQCFILGVNRSGIGNGISYVPSSAAYAPTGELLVPIAGPDAPAPSNMPANTFANNTTLYVDLDLSDALRYRDSFPLKADRRESLYRTFYL